MKKNCREKSFINRLFILFIILLLPTFFIREYRIIKSKKDTKILTSNHFSSIIFDPIKDKTFTFIILTHNDVQTIERNYESIEKQNYKFFNTIYIDQGSNDGTVELLKKKVGFNKHVQIIECLEGHTAYETYYQAVLNCPDDQIIVHLYGSDWLIHENILPLLSQSYSHPDVWLSYGQYLDYLNYQKGVMHPEPKRNLCMKKYQKAPWVIAPLKTYYAGLFKQLQLEKEFFLSIHDENALLTPMAELGKAHVCFIPDILFIHNDKKESYKIGHRLAFMTENCKDLVEQSLSHSVVDLIIVSENTPENLRSCLESTQQFLKGIASTQVIYKSDKENAIAYEYLKKYYPNIHFTPLIERHTGIPLANQELELSPNQRSRFSPLEGASYPRNRSDAEKTKDRDADQGKNHLLIHKEYNLKSALMHSLWKNEHSAPYVILATDKIKMLAPVFLPSCIEAMRRTGAYGFYLHLGKESETQVKTGIYSWDIRQNKSPFEQVDSLKMGLYRRLDLERDWKTLQFDSLEELIHSWANHSPNHRLGLSFEKPKVSTFSSDVLNRS